MLEYVDYNTEVCPHCGGKSGHPFTGALTDERREEYEDSFNQCNLMEVVDEGDGCLGYVVCCNKTGANIHDSLY